MDYKLDPPSNSEIDIQIQDEVGDKSYAEMVEYIGDQLPFTIEDQIAEIYTSLRREELDSER